MNSLGEFIRKKTEYGDEWEKVQTYIGELEDALDEAEQVVSPFFLYNKNLEGNLLAVLHRHGAQKLTVGAIRTAALWYEERLRNRLAAGGGDGDDTP